MKSKIFFAFILIAFMSLACSSNDKINQGAPKDLSEEAVASLTTNLGGTGRMTILFTENCKGNDVSWLNGLLPLEDVPYRITFSTNGCTYEQGYFDADGNFQTSAEEGKTLSCAVAGDKVKLTINESFANAQDDCMKSSKGEMVLGKSGDDSLSGSFAATFSFDEACAIAEGGDEARGVLAEINNCELKGTVTAVRQSGGAPIPDGPNGGARVPPGADPNNPPQGVGEKYNLFLIGLRDDNGAALAAIGRVGAGLVAQDVTNFYTNASDAAILSVLRCAHDIEAIDNGLAPGKMEGSADEEDMMFHGLFAIHGLEHQIATNAPADIAPLFAETHCVISARQDPNGTQGPGRWLPIAAADEQICVDGASRVAPEDMARFEGLIEEPARAPKDLPPARCGDRRVENGEQCDDGNNQNGDGCSANCQNEPPPPPPPLPGARVVHCGNNRDRACKVCVDGVCEPCDYQAECVNQ